MSWEGTISRIRSGQRTNVKEDVFTSIHIEEFELVARDTKLGKEDIPGIFPTWAKRL